MINSIISPNSLDTLLEYADNITDNSSFVKYKFFFLFLLVDIDYSLLVIIYVFAD